MKKRYLISLLAAAVVVAGGLMLMRPQSALLDPQDPIFTEDSDDEIFLEDEDVPLASLRGEEGEPADPYEGMGLDETQIKYIEEVVALVNKARVEAGVHELTIDYDLCRAAQVRAKECVTTFSHTRPDGTPYKTAIAEAGVVSNYTGENVATGHTSPQQVVSRLLKSEGHKANIINEKFTRIGIGLEKNVGNRYGGYAWSQLFVK